MKILQNNMNTLKSATLLLLAIITMNLTSCVSMDENYDKYLHQDPYAPKVTNLYVINKYKSVELHWENPDVNKISQIMITYDDQQITTDIVDTYTIFDLVIKGYSFSVITIDNNGFESIPVTVYAFPSGEE